MVFDEYDTKRNSEVAGIQIHRSDSVPHYATEIYSWARYHLLQLFDRS